MKKRRIDEMLVARGLVADIDSARRLVMAGKVRVEDQLVDKSSRQYGCDCRVEVAKPPRFVSRGGEKLQTAFERFDLNVRGLICIDVGASTGGFTDCLLQHGAAGVYAVDCGRGQLDWRLRQDQRVVVMDGVNARYLEPSEFERNPSFGVADASFISLELLLPAMCRILDSRCEIVALIKPQFEARREEVGRGGVVWDEKVRARTIQKVRSFAENNLNLKWQGVVESNIKGPAGNVEFLAYWSRNP